jgi:hypothetical protein
MACPEHMVRSRLKAISFPTERYFIHKGYFNEQTARENPRMPTKICFAYVDFDFYEPIKAALHFLHGVTQPGAMVIIDDYGFFSTGAETAVQEFLQEENSKRITYDCMIPDTRFGHFAVLTRRKDSAG